MKIFKKLQNKLYNKKNSCKIASVKASLKASYGKNVMISENTYISNDVSIGDFSYVNKNSSVENAEIGKYCSISSGVWICPYEHDINCISTHPLFQHDDIRKRVIIGNDVLISLNCIILSGVKVGDGAVIGAGAVVTKDVLPYEVVGGVPAHHIKWRFDEEKIKKLEESKWWDKKNINLLEECQNDK